MTYFDFVLTDKGLYVAPAFSHLKPDTLAIDENGETATVLKSITLGDNDDDVIEMLLIATNTTEPLQRIVQKMSVINLKWEVEHGEVD